MALQHDEGVLAAVMRELTDADRVNTSLGQSAIVLARRLDAPRWEGGMAVAAVVRELRSALEAALASAEGESDPLDELAERMKRRRGVA